MAETEVPSNASEYTFGPFRLHVGLRQLWRNGDVVALNARVFDTLLVLVRHRDRVVEKDELLKSVWPDSFVSEDSLTHSVWALRRVLEDDSSHPQYIATVPRRGYRFVARVTAQSSPDPQLAVASAVPDAVGRPLQRDEPSRPSAGPTADTRAHSVKRSAVWRSLAAGAVVAGVGLVLFAVVSTREVLPPPVGAVRALLAQPENTTLIAGGAVSPDSRYVVLVAQDNDSSRIQLWLRTLSSGESRPLPGTDGAVRPFWSPDSAAVGFFAHGRLKTLALNADAPRTIATVGINPAGASWSAHGEILFTASRSGLHLIPDTGGRVTEVTALNLDRRDRAHRWPSFLPDGRRFLYTIVSSDQDRAGTYLGSLDSAESTRLFDTPNTFAAYVPSGHVLYVHEGALLAQRFDVTGAAARRMGAPMTIAPQITSPDFLNGTAITASSGGLLTYGGGRVGGRLVWLDRQGRQLGEVDAPTALHNPTLSPDGTQLLADTTGEVNSVLGGLWHIDLTRGTRVRIGAGGSPLWSPDGRTIAFATADRGISDLYLVAPSGESDRELLLHTPDSKGLNDWSRDGRYIVFLTTTTSTKKDLWVLPMTGERVPVPFLQTPFEELQGQVSPDGRWLAYTSDESGRWEVYVQSFPERGAKHVVSTGGGGEPQWRADGRELFYLALDNTLMSVSVTPGTVWRSGRPEPLFRAPVVGDLTRYRTRYQVTSDGNRILMDAVDTRRSQEPTLIVNWPAVGQARTAR